MANDGRLQGNGLVQVRVDATVYGFLLAARCPPWDGPLQRAVNERPALTGFCDAVARRVWGAPVET